MTQVSNFVLVIISKYKKVLQEVFEVFEWPISVYVYIYGYPVSMEWAEMYFLTHYFRAGFFKAVHDRQVPTPSNQRAIFKCVWALFASPCLPTAEECEAAVNEQPFEKYRL